MSGFLTRRAGFVLIDRCKGFEVGITLFLFIIWAKIGILIIFAMLFALVDLVFILECYWNL